MGSETQFCLRWNNHQLNMLTVFENLLQSQILVDVTLACDGLTLRAHKMVLSACSPYFQTIFTENPCKHPIVILKDVSANELQALLDFMYKGEVNVSQEKLSSLLKTADYLKIKGLSEVCRRGLDTEETTVVTARKTPNKKPNHRRRFRDRQDSVSSPPLSSSSKSDHCVDMKGSPEIVETQVDLPPVDGSPAVSDKQDHVPQLPAMVELEPEANVDENDDNAVDLIKKENDTFTPPMETDNSPVGGSSPLSGMPSTSNAQALIPLSRRALAYAPQRCRLCQKVISNIYNFRKHMKVHSPVQQRFECHLCLRVYNREDNLRWHLRTKHGVQLRRKPRRPGITLLSHDHSLLAPVSEQRQLPP
uniref:BTB domain-containing protein n=1 Tax=Strigamia maritima TaxID=126957 RepID=T1JEK0_STRMM